MPNVWKGIGIHLLIQELEDYSDDSLGEERLDNICKRGLESINFVLTQRLVEFDCYSLS